jgi:hypothetical protein
MSISGGVSNVRKREYKVLWVIPSSIVTLERLNTLRQFGVLNWIVLHSEAYARMTANVSEWLEWCRNAMNTYSVDEVRVLLSMSEPFSLEAIEAGFKHFVFDDEGKLRQVLGLGSVLSKPEDII